MNNLFYILKTIYTNRYRQLTYKDSSAFWIPFLLYFLLIFKLLNGSFPTLPTYNIQPYVVLFFSFTACQFANQRKDWDLLKALFPSRKIYFIYFIDLLLLNCFNLLVTIYSGWINYSSIIIGFVLFFTFYKVKIDRPFFKLPFRILDVYTILQLRRYKIHYVVFVLLYYVAYQGLIEQNRNLFVGCVLGILVVLFQNQQKTEKLEYFVLSKYSNRQYIIKTEIDFIVNSVLITLPCFVLSLIFNINYFLYGLISFGLIFLLFPIKYMMLNQKLPIAFSSMFLILIYFSAIVNEEIDWLLLCSFIPISIILYVVVFRKFTKERITEDSEFYL